MQHFAREIGSLRQELNANTEMNTSLVAENGNRRAAEEKIKALFRRLVCPRRIRSVDGYLATSTTSSVSRLLRSG